MSQNIPSPHPGESTSLGEGRGYPESYLNTFHVNEVKGLNLV